MPQSERVTPACLALVRLRLPKSRTPPKKLINIALQQMSLGGPERQFAASSQELSVIRGEQPLGKPPRIQRGPLGDIDLEKAGRSITVSFLRVSEGAALVGLLGG